MATEVIYIFEFNQYNIYHTKEKAIVIANNYFYSDNYDFLI